MENKLLYGMIHLPPLPGSPESKMKIREIIDYAVTEINGLKNAGLKGVILENLGDYPFYKENIPPITVAAMSAISEEIKKVNNIEIGVNVLRNGCIEAMSIASLFDFDFIRCNVLTGAYVTDQGIIEGKGADLLRFKRFLNSHVKIYADVHVKHSYPLYNVPVDIAAEDLSERGGADAVIFSGSRSPIPPEAEKVKLVKNSIDKPVLIGSGISFKNFFDYVYISDGMIIGESDFKKDGISCGPSDFEAFKKLMDEYKKL